MDFETTSCQQVRAACQKIWGYEQLREPQEMIINSLLSQRDVFVVMPTGGGKSICFQLPALLQTGLTLVVTPLVALMENQVKELRDRQLPAALLHSELSPQQRRRTEQLIERQQLRLLYLSPETLLSVPVWKRLCQPELKINGLILDEAHCLVQWGDFRPAYRRLGAVRPALLQSKPAGTKIAIAAFTATATPSTQQTIERVLQLKQPVVFRQNPLRSNIYLQVQKVWTPRGRRQKLLHLIQAQTGSTGLVYVRSRRDSESLAQHLGQLGYAAAAYHAGLDPAARRAIEASWLNGTTPIVICTSAFGMGINKPNVRWVVHFHAPLLLAEYVQEIGRAGRDGKPAQALMLVSANGWIDPEDKQRQRFLQSQELKHRQMAQELLHKIPLRGDIGAVSRQFKHGAIALSLLHSTGHLEWQDPFRYAINTKQNAAAQAQREQALVINRYILTKQCRWQFILAAFGFAQDAVVPGGCGCCDRCLPSRNYKNSINSTVME